MIDTTVYIPCFNAARTIEQCLGAVLAQTYSIKEILVIDDGSTDETVQILSRYPVRVIRHRQNQGLAAARNSAVKNIQSEFVASLDADCIPEKNWLKHLIEQIDSSSIAGVGGKLCEAYASSACDQWRSIHMRQHWDEAQSEPPFLFGSNTVFRRKVLVDAGLYDERFKTNYEDVDICQRIKKAGYLLKYEPQALVHHLRQDNLYTLLNNHWQWQLPYYVLEDFFTPEKFLSKVETNIGLADRYMREDIVSNRVDLLYINFFLSVHHTLKDFEFFFFRNPKEERFEESSSLSLAVALWDLIIFYHMDKGLERFFSLAHKSQALWQNFFAFGLVLSNSVRRHFTRRAFRGQFFQDMFLSINPTMDRLFLNEFIDLADAPHDWGKWREKEQPYLNRNFLNNFSLGIENWVEGLKRNYPLITLMLEEAAPVTAVP